MLYKFYDVGGLIAVDRTERTENEKRIKYANL